MTRSGRFFFKNFPGRVERRPEYFFDPGRRSDRVEGRENFVQGKLKGEWVRVKREMGSILKGKWAQVKRRVGSILRGSWLDIKGEMGLILRGSWLEFKGEWARV